MSVLCVWKASVRTLFGRILFRI